MKTKWIDIHTGEYIWTGNFVSAHLKEGWSAQGVLISENTILLKDEGLKEVKEVVAFVKEYLLPETKEWVEQVRKEYRL